MFNPMTVFSFNQPWNPLKTALLLLGLGVMMTKGGWVQSSPLA
jgi:hypothetical protein